MSSNETENRPWQSRSATLTRHASAEGIRGSFIAWRSSIRCWRPSPNTTLRGGALLSRARDLAANRKLHADELIDELFSVVTPIPASDEVLEAARNRVQIG